jgi:hypothetical protein
MADRRLLALSRYGPNQSALSRRFPRPELLDHELSRSEASSDCFAELMYCKLSDQPNS